MNKNRKRIEKKQTKKDNKKSISFTVSFINMTDEEIEGVIERTISTIKKDLQNDSCVNLESNENNSTIEEKEKSKQTQSPAWDKIWRILKAPFVKRKDYTASGTNATNLLLSANLSTWFSVFSSLLFVVFLFCIVGYPLVSLFADAISYKLIIHILLGLLGIVSYITSGVLRLSSFEIENNNDGNYLATLFAGVVTFASLVIGLIALFK